MLPSIYNRGAVIDPLARKPQPEPRPADKGISIIPESYRLPAINRAGAVGTTDVMKQRKSSRPTTREQFHGSVMDELDTTISRDYQQFRKAYAKEIQKSVDLTHKGLLPDRNPDRRPFRAAPSPISNSPTPPPIAGSSPSPPLTQFSYPLRALGPPPAPVSQQPAPLPQRAIKDAPPAPMPSSGRYVYQPPTVAPSAPPAPPDNSFRRRTPPAMERRDSKPHMAAQSAAAVQPQRAAPVVRREEPAAAPPAQAPAPAPVAAASAPPALAPAQSKQEPVAPRVLQLPPQPAPVPAALPFLLSLTSSAEELPMLSLLRRSADPTYQPLESAFSSTPGLGNVFRIAENSGETLHGIALLKKSALTEPSEAGDRTARLKHLDAVFELASNSNLPGLRALKFAVHTSDPQNEQKPATPPSGGLAAMQKLLQIGASLCAESPNLALNGLNALYRSVSDSVQPVFIRTSQATQFANLENLFSIAEKSANVYPWLSLLESALPAKKQAKAPPADLRPVKRNVGNDKVEPKALPLIFTVASASHGTFNGLAKLSVASGLPFTGPAINFTLNGYDCLKTVFQLAASGESRHPALALLNDLMVTKGAAPKFPIKL